MASRPLKARWAATNGTAWSQAASSATRSSQISQKSQKAGSPYRSTPATANGGISESASFNAVTPTPHLAGPRPLTPIRTQDRRVFLIVIVKGLLDDIVPVPVRDIHKKDIPGLMRFHRILELLWHLKLAKEPARIPMRGISVHRILIGKLIP